MAAVAVAAGHSVTCLARGTNPIPEGVRFVRADRDEPGALNPVRGRRWDAVVELATAPGRVRRAVTEIEAGHWIYVSSVSVYRDHSTPHRTEDASVHAPLAADVLAGPEDYGPAKAACELAVREAARAGERDHCRGDDRGDGRSATVIRPGLIGGLEDDTGRSGYYPWRFAHPTGGDVIVPDEPGFPVYLIDVKDLAGWMVRCAEQRIPGTFNASGPTTTLAEAIEEARRVAGRCMGCRAPENGGTVVPALPVAARLLAENGVQPWMGPDSLPWWIPDPAWHHASSADSSRAVATALAFRPLQDTLADALAYEHSRGEPRGAGLSAQTERRVRDAQLTLTHRDAPLLTAVAVEDGIGS